MRKVVLFVPCLVDQVYPEMGIATYALLSQLGFEVVFKPEISCCGQPAFNAGHMHEAKCVASDVQRELSGQIMPTVCPSGSCTAMMRNFYPQLFAGESGVHQTPHVFELAEFLVKHGLESKLHGSFPHRVGFHNSCHSLRELGLVTQTPSVLRRFEGLELVGLEDEAICCGFGGLFSVKFKAISERMAKSRLDQFVEHRAEVVVSNDPGCIMQLRQEVARKNSTVRVLHVSELCCEAMGIVPSLAAA